MAAWSILCAIAVSNLVIAVAKAPLKAGDLPEDTLIIDSSELELSEAEIATDNLLNNLLADLGDSDDVKITVYKVKKGNDMTWVKSFGPTELDMDLESLLTGLRDSYGGGKYKIQVREKGQIRKAKMIEIEPPPVTGEYDQAAAIRELKAENQSESMGGMATMFAQMMKANQDQMQHQADSQQRFMETMVTAMSGRSNDQPAFDPVTGMTAMIQSMSELHKLTAPAAQPDATEMILKGVELVSAIRGDGDGGGEANIYTVLSKAMGSFGETLTHAMNMPPMPTQPQPQIASQPQPGQPPKVLTDADAPRLVTEQPAPGAQPETPAATPEEIEARARFEPYVDYLIQLAEKNSDQELYAEVILDQLGPTVAHAWLSTPEGLEQLARQWPKVTEHMEWFVEVGAQVDLLVREEQNLGEGTGSQQTDGDVSTGDEHPVSTITHSDQTPLDGTAERIGGDQDDADDNVEAGK